MMRVALLAQRSFSYAGTTVRAGEPFLAHSAFDATALIMAGHAIATTDPVPDVQEPPALVTPRRRARRRAMTADAD